jgi:UDP-2-acetamido-3-amino-2,3-dideoxy-glucuronate N-acetyltransferase
VPPFSIVVGNPGRIIGYVQANANRLAHPIAKGDPGEACGDLGVRGTWLYELPVVEDLRGRLTYAEIDQSLPFVPKRFFMMYAVPSKDVRGEHAHRECHQFLVCTRGSCSVVVDDGENRAEVLLDRPNLGLHIAPMVWATEYRYSSEAALLVLASDIYKAEDYIRNYDQFLAEIHKR